MAELIKHSREYLEHLRIESLSALYMNTFILSKKKIPEAQSELMIISDVLAQRKFEEKKIVEDKIKNQLEIATKGGYYHYEVILRDMQSFFRQYILD